MTTPNDAVFPLGATTAAEALALLAERFPLEPDRDEFMSVLLAVVPTDDDGPMLAAAFNGIFDLLIECLRQNIDQRAVCADVAGLIRDVLEPA